MNNVLQRGVKKNNFAPTEFKLHQKDADSLRARGFKVRADNIVEWVKLDAMPGMIFG